MVVAIMGLLVGSSVAVFNGAQSMSQVSSNVGSLLDEARTQAMAHNTYVWVGFATVNDSSGNPAGIEIMAVESQSGQASDLAAGTVTPVMKPRYVPNVNLSSTVSITGMSTSSTSTDISTSTMGSFTTKLSNGTQTFTNIIQFSPQGETLVKSTLVPWVNVGLVPVRGRMANVAALQISGTTGDVRLFQP